MRGLLPTRLVQTLNVPFGVCDRDHAHAAGQDVVAAGVVEVGARCGRSGVDAVAGTCVWLLRATVQQENRGQYR